MSLRRARWTRYGALACAGLAALMLIPADRAGLFATGSEEQVSAPPASAPASVDVPPASAVRATTAASSGNTTLMTSEPTAASAPVPIIKQGPPLLTNTGQDQGAPTAAPSMSASEQSEVPYIVASAVNVRSGPSSAGAALFVLQPGEEVSVVETQKDWVRILSRSGQGGWIYSAFLSAPAGATTSNAVPSADPQPELASTRQQEQEPSPEALFVRVSDRVVLLASPSKSAQPLLVLKAGQRVAVVETRGRWLRVAVSSGPSGWILSR